MLPKLNKIDFYVGYLKILNNFSLTHCSSLSGTLMEMSAHGATLQNMRMEYIGNTVKFHPAEVRAP